MLILLSENMHKNIHTENKLIKIVNFIIWKEC